MRARGFVLAGGLSRRMGRDKALLPWHGSCLLAHAAATLSEVASSVTVVGPPELYSGLGFPVLPDLRPGLGPLAGLETALHHTDADWNLLLACDFPEISPDALAGLSSRAEAGDADAVLPGSPLEPQPLCAIYHRRILPVVTAQLDANRLKMRDILKEIRTVFVPEIAPPLNVNTPSDWLAAGGVLD